jgi:hypothetical protein
MNISERKIIVSKKIVRQKRDLRFDPNYRGLQSLKGLKQYFELKVINGIKQYFCKFNNKCNYFTKRSQGMAFHINIFHLKTRKFKCSQNNCEKVFSNPHTLSEHELNHLCGYGFGIGSKINTICGNKSINRYRNRALINDKKLYECIWNGCQFKTQSHISIKEHIHKQHLCPNRVKHFDLKSEEVIEQKFPLNRSAREIEIIRKVKPFFERTLIDNQNMFVCKWNECKFNSKKLQIISLHINDKHLRQTNLDFNRVKQLTQSHHFEDIDSEDRNKILISSNKRLNSNDNMTNRFIYNKTNDNKICYARKEVWKPFKCHFNNCSNRFLTLDVMRDHLKEHKTQN